MIDLLARATIWARLARALLLFEGRNRDAVIRLALESLVTRKLSREFLGHLLLRGEGLEIGALNRPLPLPHGVRVRYVDRFTEEELRRHYPELDGQRLVPVHILDDGERLGTVADDSQDFVIANSFIEHCEDPIGSLGHMFRVLRPGGLLYLGVPDKRYTFDKDRPVTPLEHLLRDHREGPDWSRRAHYEEWVRIVKRISDPEKATREAERLVALRYSIHFHVWTQEGILEWLVALPRQAGATYTVVASWFDGEQVLLMRKT